MDSVMWSAMLDELRKIAEVPTRGSMRGKKKNAIMESGKAIERNTSRGISAY